MTQPIDIISRALKDIGALEAREVQPELLSMLYTLILFIRITKY